VKLIVGPLLQAVHNRTALQTQAMSLMIYTFNTEGEAEQHSRFERAC
jgi:hypothetical protein